MPNSGDLTFAVMPIAGSATDRAAKLALLMIVFLVLLARSSVAFALATPIALTFDDVPLFGTYAPPAEAEQITTRLLSGFKRHHWPVTGFVNEIQLEGKDRPERIGLLTRWLDAGLDLGNHGYSHLSFTNTPVDAYIADVARGEVATSALLAARGRSERWYRHPYLETGATLAARRRFEGWLAKHGYRVAPVSMENSDWEFAEPYDYALAHGDKAGAEHIRKEYLDFTARVVPWYRKAARNLLGREPAFVFLLHASRLNSVSLDALAAILRKDHLHPVSLDRAMADPAYRIEDDYAGPDGDEWVTRWSLALHKSLSYADLPLVPSDIAQLDTRVEAAWAASSAPTANLPGATCCRRGKVR
jgi:peptidoglycan/xylan/chitin deacetylase (PgdA/CDA1 family)